MAQLKLQKKYQKIAKIQGYPDIIFLIILAGLELVDFRI
jgi:hypothetical protein